MDNANNWWFIQVYSGQPNSINGCATFFRKDKFIFLKKYEVGVCCYSHGSLWNHLLIQFHAQVEFKKAANSVIESVVPATQKKAASHRLAKVVAALHQVHDFWPFFWISSLFLMIIFVTLSFGRIILLWLWFWKLNSTVMDLRIQERDRFYVWSVDVFLLSFSYSVTVHVCLSLGSSGYLF